MPISIESSDEDDSTFPRCSGDGVESSKGVRRSERIAKIKPLNLDQKSSISDEPEVAEQQQTKGPLDEYSPDTLKSLLEDGTLKWGMGHKDDGVERSIQVFDKIFTRSMASAGQTLALPRRYVRNHVRPYWKSILLETPEGKTYICKLKRRTPDPSNVDINIGHE